MRSAFVAAVLAAGCTGSGSLELQLSLPSSPDLRPTNMTTVSVLATSAGMDPISNTSVLSGTSFSAGDLPIGTNIQIDVLLHDVSNRLVGLGEAPQLVDLAGDQATTLAIPVRRPFIYASNGSTLYTYDPSLDPRDPKFQGQLTGLTSPQIAVSVGGDRLVVAGPTQLQIVDTATHKVVGSPIALPGGAMLRDVAPVPGSHQVAVAHSLGITIIDIDTMAAQTAMTGSVDKVAVGPAADGKMFAYGLVARAAAAGSPLEACSGASSLVAVAVANPATSAPKPLGVAVSGLAAAPDRPFVFVTLPCTGQVARVDGDPTSEVSQLTLTKISDLAGAAALAVLGDRVWAAGTKASTPVCGTATGNLTTCTTTTAMSCPEPNATHLSYVSAGAHVVVQSIPLDGGTPVVLELPERRETMINTDDPANQHAQVLHSLGVVPLDLVALPGGQYISVITKSSYYIESLSDGVQILLPCLEVTTGDWLLLDMASSSVAQRVRTECDLTVGPNAYFHTWVCDDPPEAERSTVGTYLPTSIGALFGAR